MKKGIFILFAAGLAFFFKNQAQADSEEGTTHFKHWINDRIVGGENNHGFNQKREAVTTVLYSWWMMGNQQGPSGNKNSSSGNSASASTISPKVTKTSMKPGAVATTPDVHVQESSDAPGGSDEKAVSASLMTSTSNGALHSDNGAAAEPEPEAEPSREPDSVLITSYPIIIVNKDMKKPCVTSATSTPVTASKESILNPFMNFVHNPAKKTVKKSVVSAASNLGSIASNYANYAISFTKNATAKVINKFSKKGKSIEEQAESKDYDSIEDTEDWSHQDEASNHDDKGSNGGSMIPYSVWLAAISILVVSSKVLC